LQARPTGTRPTGRPSVSSTLSHEFFDVQEFDDGNQVSISFYACLLCQYFCAKQIHSQNITREKLSEALWYKKFLGKMFMKLTPSLYSTFLQPISRKAGLFYKWQRYKWFNFLCQYYLFLRQWKKAGPLYISFSLFIHIQQGWPTFFIAGQIWKLFCISGRSI